MNLSPRILYRTILTYIVVAAYIQFITAVELNWLQAARPPQSSLPSGLTNDLLLFSLI